MRYPAEHFSDEERALLAPHFTNLDRPVFALVNLPETVKGALFARYSRYSGSVRRLYLDEFAADMPASGRPFDAEEGARAADLYERIFVGYGDDSIAQVGGAHVACEWVSNILTKVLQRGRLAAYLEQSTRYIPYDKALPEGGYRFYREDGLGPEFADAMSEIFVIYSRSLGKVEEWAAGRWPRGDGEPEAAWRRSIRAKALDLLRGLLPAATLSHVGIYASGQAYEQLILRLMASPLPEARDFGAMILRELQQVMPSFVSRVERPDRGGEWINYLQARRAGTEQWVERLGLGRREEADPAPAVDLLHVEGSEVDLLAASLFEAAGGPRARGPRRGRGARRRRARPDPRRHRRRSRQPPAPSRARLRGAPLPLRDRLRLRRLPRPPAPPDADRAVAAAQSRPRRRHSRRGSRSGRRRRIRTGAGDLPGRVRAAGRGRAR